jgi:alpha-amylase
MKTIYFILGVHNHQPVGNFDHVFEEAYQASYLPMVKALCDFPGVRMMYHTTGPLFDWLEAHHPEYFDILNLLVDRGQLEIMTGGYYEPILAIIPDRDKRGQIEMMSSFIERRWKIRPRGMWMAERVWEPHLAKPLNESGVEFITLDDYHFFSAGLSPDDLLGYYRSDEQGYPISIFPISKRLRYLIPFGEPEAALGYLREKADERGDNLLVMADDGEKFGLWPGTYEWVHEKGWLRRFFTALENAASEGWLKLTTCSQFMAEHPARGRVYLPCASYFEMSAWSLPAAAGAKLDQLQHRYQNEGRLDELQPFLKGGFWRNFLAKYDEANRMYRKMLWISEQVLEKEKEAAFPDVELEAARRALYKAQCNCAYWHGVFGGLYLPHLRHAVYQNLLEAEAHLNWPQTPFTWARQADFDGDGSPEIYLRNHQLGIIASLRDGGAIYEFDYLPARFNLLNTLKRQPEAYHGQVALAGAEIKEGESIHDQVRSKEQGLEQYLVYDRHSRGALLDHFLSAQESPQSLMSGRYYELGDFVGKPYERAKGASLTGSSFEITRTAAVVDNQVELRKAVILPVGEDTLQITYRIRNTSAIPLTILFALEFNFALLSGDCAERYYYQADRGLDRAPLNSIGICEAVRRFSLFDEDDGFAVHFEFAEPTEIWRYPCETVSQSEGGFERNYQSSCVLPIFRLTVAGEGEFSTSFRVRLQLLR